MKKIIFSLVLGLSVLFSNIVYGQYYSSGQYSCGNLLANTDNEYYKLIAESWAQGYMSARNYSEKKSKGRSLCNTSSVANSLFYAIMKYCRENPLKDTDDAMVHIYENELK